MKDDNVLPTRANVGLANNSVSFKRAKANTQVEKLVSEFGI